MTVHEERIPVIIGVGQVNDRPEDPESGLDSFGLMARSLEIADADAGGGWLRKADSLTIIDQSSFRQLGDLSPRLADRFGAKPRYCYRTPSRSGVGPIRLLNEAADRIAAGDIGIAAIVGAEALLTASRRAAAQSGTDVAAHNTVRSLSDAGASPYRARYGVTAPVDIYPLYENATRAAWGQSLTEGQRESGEIWSLMSGVAADTEGAWTRKRMAIADILQVTADNRPIAFPYTKFMVANSSVNQGAGFIVTSLAQAKRRNLRGERIVYVGRGAAANEPDDFLHRDRYDRSAGMTASLRETMRANRLTRDDLDFVELYSCFPCVPKMARRLIDWPADQPATVFGGLSFGGGPIGNYMSHAVIGMAAQLGHHGGRGLLYANGGVMTNNHAIILASEPIRQPGENIGYDVQDMADEMRGPIPALDEGYLGKGTIETYTVFYERDAAPRFAVVVGRAETGARFLAKIPAVDRDGIARLTSGEIEPVGTSGTAVAAPNGDTLWRCAG